MKDNKRLPQAAECSASQGVAEALSLSLAQACTHFSQGKLAVAYSGGLDSTVLLHAASAWAKEHHQALVALHIHHGLSPHADDWLSFCAQQAKRWNVEFAARRVSLPPQPREGLEGAARQARYTALSQLCLEHGVTVLLSAHHMDDQAETVLLQLLRGAGVQGLAAMPVFRCLPSGYEVGGQDSMSPLPVGLLRPFLQCSRRQLAAYAQAYGLVHIEDESNADVRLARNAIRHRLAPVMSELQPAFARAIARSARHLAEAQSLLDELAQQDLIMVQAGPDALSLCALTALPLARVRNLMRYWLRLYGRMPGERRLEALLAQLLRHQNDSQTVFHHAGVVLRIWRGIVWCDSAHNQEGYAGTKAKKAESVSLDWRGHTVWQLPEWGGEVLFEPTVSGDGIPEQVLWASTLHARPRAGGERIRLAVGRPSRTLKNVFQEAEIPPWRRQVPVIWLGEQLLFVPHIGMDCQWQTADTCRLTKNAESQTCYALRWRGFASPQF